MNKQQANQSSNRSYASENMVDLNGGNSSCSGGGVDDDLDMDEEEEDESGDV